MTTLTKFIERQARAHPDMPGTGMNRIGLLMMDYINAGGTFPLSDEAYEKEIESAFITYETIKDERLDKSGKLSCDAWLARAGGA
jgi:hypothetical protein